MNTILSVYLKNVYGVMHVYLARNTEEQKKQARAIQTLTGRSTLTVSDTQALKQLGFEFKEVLPDEDGSGIRASLKSGV